jgi:hypothetical protein
MIRSGGETLLFTRKYLLLVLLMMVLLISACSGGKDTDDPGIPAATVTTEPAATPYVTPAPTAGAETPYPAASAEPSASPSPEPAALPDRNPLTGLPMDAETLSLRPYAVVFGNTQASLPQSGLAAADIIYEVLSEGVITRIIAVYKDINAPRIGSVRSLRGYFLHFMNDHDAIVVHHGTSTEGGTAMWEQNTNNINGSHYDGSTFWRDPFRWSRPNLREHSSFTSAENLISRANNLRYRTTTEVAEGIFGFYGVQTVPNGGEAVAERITIPYGQGFRPVFVFDRDTQTYDRFQYNAAHIDDATGEQISVTNVVVQIVESWLIPGDSAGRRNFQLIGSGGGWLFTAGTVVPLTWSKADVNSPTVWMDADGNKLNLNPGQTWVNVLSAQPIYE